MDSCLGSRKSEEPHREQKPRCTFSEDFVFAGHASFPDDLYQYSLLSPAVELPIEDLFPRTKIQFPFRNRHDDLSPHDLSLHVRVGIVFPSIVVAVLPDWFVRRELFQPRLIIVVKSPLIIVDEDGRGDVHGVYESESFLNAALKEARLYLGRDIDESVA